MPGRAWPRWAATLVTLWAAAIGVARAQDSVTIRADSIFYGDNTEFRNPFREGETIFGAALRLAAAVALGRHAELTVGAFGNQRFGSQDGFDLVRPVISLRIAGTRHAFTFGTLPHRPPGAPAGPDRAGPHALLPPMQRETLAFDRPYEAGLAWTFDSPRVRHEAWLDWQRLNTPEHRERFDAGMKGSLRLAGAASMPFELFVVHEGGQQFASGPVSDSLAAAAGVAIEGPPKRLTKGTLELYALASRDTPDRAATGRPRDGSGVLGRASVQRRGWRAHALFWRGKSFVTREGDPNYLSVRRDGSRHRGIRDYAEAGVTRTFAPGPGVLLEASARVHRVERHYEYSYRIVAGTRSAWRFTPGR